MADLRPLLAAVVAAAVTFDAGATLDQVTGDLDRFVVPLEASVVPLVRAIAPMAGDANALIAEEGAGEVSFDLAADVFFDFDRADLRPEARVYLEDVAARIAEDAPASVAIAGHTDTVGDPAYNQDLSERRAGAVAAFLADEAGLGEVAMTVEGFGESRPVAPNELENADGDLVDNPAGRQRNRRVEITYADPDASG